MKQILNAPWFPAAAPFLTYILMTSLEGMLPRYFVPLYCIKLILTVAAIALTRKTAGRQARFLGETPRLQDYAIAVGIGISLGLSWIPIDHFTPHTNLLGHRSSYDPFTAISDPAIRSLFLVARFTGLVLVVPYVEELFYRGLLLRAATNPEDWNASTIGKFSTSAMAINIGLFALSHPEWLAAAVFAGVMCWLTRYSRGLVAPMLAHGVTNLVLGIIIVVKGQWGYW
jgi:CAAX prenyl protease-like protein